MIKNERLEDIEEGKEQHQEQGQPEDESRWFAATQLTHVLLMFLSESPVLKTRKFLLLARLLLRIVIDGTVVPLTGFLYFWEKYGHNFELSAFSILTQV